MWKAKSQENIMTNQTFGGVGKITSFYRWDNGGRTSLRWKGITVDQYNETTYLD